jgi:hypothetical protein
MLATIGIRTSQIMNVVSKGRPGGLPVEKSGSRPA